VLGQSFLPRKIFIVDSSDNACPVAAITAKANQHHGIEVVHLRAPPGTSLQRNIGLAYASASVTLFLDDDSLLLPGAIAAIMRIYQADRNQEVGGVCSREAVHASGSIIHKARTAYAMRVIDAIKLRLSKSRYRIEARLFPDPLLLHGKLELGKKKPPPWLERENATLVEHMTGFRMSFRTRLIKDCGFDEILGRYALAEDIDASFAILKTHLLVGANTAEIFHYKDPDRRDTGHTLGVTHILNQAYVICKHAPRGSLARSRLKPFVRYKIFLYTLTLGSSFGRARLLGALRAYQFLDDLLQSPPSDLAKAYLEVRNKCLGSGPT
jgi:glycosyltransferase involved in cell wall biosynthesis